jgi:hypothetical protein
VLLLAASLLVHALALEGMARLGRHDGGMRRAPALAVRLVPAVAHPARQGLAPAAGALSAAAPVPSALPAPAASTQQGNAASTAPPPAGAIAAALGLPLGQGQSAPLGDEPPARYRIVLPPPATVDYAVSYAAPGQSSSRAGGSATMTWAPGTDTYAVSLAARDGAISSSGMLGDDGILPVENRAGDGTTRFDRAAGTISFDQGPALPMQRGVQDRLSVLIQLAAIGNANPEQLGNGVEILVGGAREAGVVRFARVGEENVDGPGGRVAAVHMAQVARPGAARLDVWLAPGLHWLPVMMVATNADGSTVTQVMRAVR